MLLLFLNKIDWKRKLIFFKKLYLKILPNKLNQNYTCNYFIAILQWHVNIQMVILLTQMKHTLEQNHLLYHMSQPGHFSNRVFGMRRSPIKLRWRLCHFTSTMCLAAFSPASMYALFIAWFWVPICLSPLCALILCIFYCCVSWATFLGNHMCFE